jgi:membrane protein involved in colicin uptake
LKTRVDIISENQASDAAAADAEQKRLASKAVVDKAAAEAKAVAEAKAAKAKAEAEAKAAAAAKAAADAAAKALADARAAQAAAEARAAEVEAARAAEVKARADAAAEAERVRIANMTVRQKAIAGHYNTFAQCWADASGDWGRNGKFNCCEEIGAPYPNRGDTGYAFCQDNT